MQTTNDICNMQWYGLQAIVSVSGNSIFIDATTQLLIRRLCDLNLKFWIRLDFLSFEFSGSDIALFEHYRVNWKTETITSSHGYLVTWNWLFNLKKFELFHTKVRYLYWKSVWRNENKANFISCRVYRIQIQLNECWMLNIISLPLRYNGIFQWIFNWTCFHWMRIDWPINESMHSTLNSNLLMILSAIWFYYKTYQFETICLPKIRNVNSTFKWK